jgi:hypothetical protein
MRSAAEWLMLCADQRRLKPRRMDELVQRFPPPEARVPGDRVERRLAASIGASAADHVIVTARAHSTGAAKQ